MGIQKMILNLIMRVESWFLRLFRIHADRITFISLESDTLQADFRLLYDELHKQPEIDLRLCLIHYQKHLWGQFLYFLNCLKQLYYIYTSHIVILNDNNYAVSQFKRKGVIVLQVWHACGAVKKFGNVIERKYPITNYDYVLSTSDYWKQPYSVSFGVKPEHVLPLGMPRTDELFDQTWLAQSRSDLLKRYPSLSGKKIILYAPTFRGDVYEGFSTVPFDAEAIIRELGEDYVILYKFHPLLGNVQLAKHERIINMNHEDTHALFSLCDYMISDYSSVVFDYMILEKPLLFFVPDWNEYSNERGVFVDVHELGCPVCETEAELVTSIRQDAFDIHTVQRLKKTFIAATDGKSTERVCAFLQEQLQQPLR